MKKHLCLLLTLVLVLLSACSNSTQIPAEKLLGADDAQLVQARGEGLAADYEHNGETLVMQRRYTESIFGLDAQAEYMYSDAQKVNQIVFTFESADIQHIVDTISKNLGEPIEKQDQTMDLDFMVRWEKENVVYTLRTIPNAGIYLLMEAK